MSQDIIRIRRDNNANWTSVNPVLSLGEISYDTTNKQFRVGDGTTAWLSLTAIGNIVTDGDKGDVVVSGGGTTWNLDSALITTINNKLDSGPLDGGTALVGDQVIQLRRDINANWTGVVLADGEIGYDETVNEIRVGNGTSVWDDLDPIGLPKFSQVNLQQLGDVDYPNTLVVNDVLTWDGSGWINQQISAPVLDIDDLNDVSISSPQNTEVLQFNGTSWVNAALDLGGLSSTIPTGSKNEITVNSQNNWTINAGVIEQANLNLLDPVSLQQAATKNYADYIGGLSIATIEDQFDQVNGIAILDSTRKIATNRLATGTASSGTILRGDRVWTPFTVSLSQISQDGATFGSLLGWSTDAGQWKPFIIANTSTVTRTVTDTEFSKQITLNVGTITNSNISDNTISGSKLTADSVPLSKLDTSGTASGSTFLRGDGEWAAVTASMALDDLTDVIVSSPVNLHVLSYDAVQGKWLNKTLANAGIAATVHDQAISTITSPTGVAGQVPKFFVTNSPTTGAGIFTVGYVDNTSIQDGTIAVGKLNITGTANAENFLRGDGSWTNSIVTGTFTSALNQALLKKVRNNTGSTIAKGKVVYIVGSLGDNLTVALADASVEATAATTIGITAESINTGEDGVIVCQGVIDGLTGITSPFVDGDALWLSETAGEFTRVRPTQPAHGVALGWVMSTSAGSAGRIYVKVNNGQELDEIHDVLISSPQTGHLISRNQTTGLWVNQYLSNTNIVDNTISGAKLTTDSIPLSKLDTSGTASISTFLRGDGTWSSLTFSNISDTGALGYIPSYSVYNSVWQPFSIGTSSSITRTIVDTEGTQTITFNVATITNSNITDNTISGSKITNTSLGVGKINATGTASSSTYLRGDGTWSSAVVADGDKGDITVSGSGTTWTIDAGVVGTSKLGGDITLAGKALLDDTSNTDQRATLGLGGLATLSTIGNSEITDNTISGSKITNTTLGIGKINATGTASASTYLRGDGTWSSISSSVADGDKGDITVSGSGNTWTIDAGVVGTSKLGGDITAAGKALLDDSDAEAQRTTLGLGGLATKSTVTNSEITDATISVGKLSQGTAVVGQVLGYSNIVGWGPVNASGGGGAPTDAQYVVLSSNGTLTDERVLTGNDHITIADAGAGNNATLNWQYKPKKRVSMFSDMNAAGDWTVFSSGTGTSNAFNTASLSDGNHVGVLNSGTGTQNTGRAGIGSAGLDIVALGSGESRYTTVIKIPTLSTATERFEVFCGFTDSLINTNADAVYFYYKDDVNSGKWQARTYNNLTSTFQDTGITADTGWHSLEIIVNSAGTEAKFYIDGTLTNTITTNIPTGTTRATGINNGIQKTVGTTARNLHTDALLYEEEVSR